MRAPPVSRSNAARLVFLAHLQALNNGGQMKSAALSSSSWSESDQNNWQLAEKARLQFDGTKSSVDMQFCHKDVLLLYSADCSVGKVFTFPGVFILLA